MMRAICAGIVLTFAAYTIGTSCSYGDATPTFDFTSSQFVDKLNNQLRTCAEDRRSASKRAKRQHASSATFISNNPCSD